MLASVEVNMNLVVGASGLLGTQICRELAQAGKPIRALVRNSTDPEKQKTLQGLGASLAYGDLKDPSTLDEACRGISTVISTASSTLSRQAGDSIETVDAQGLHNLVRAAKTAGVGHFIFVSFAPIPFNFALQRAKRTTEKMLIESDVAYTVLQPTMFTEVWLGPHLGFDAANAKAQIFGTGLNSIDWISYLDVARYTVASLDNAAARNCVIPLGGPESLSPLQAVGIFEEEGGRKFTVTHVPEEALEAQRAGATDSLQEAFATLMLSYAAGSAIDMGQAGRLFPKQTKERTRVRKFAQDVFRGA
jgi:uncharacterized protein YbjT (DUF2867 family)